MGHRRIEVHAPSAEQDPAADSFIGGRPKLPASMDLPTCGRRDALQSFFFQVAFPDGHAWAGRTLAVFECTACMDDLTPVPTVNRDLIPAMRTFDLVPGDDVPDGALEHPRYQHRARFLVFPTAAGSIRRDSPVRVRFRTISLAADAGRERSTASRIGGRPAWIEDDRSPGTYRGEPLDFLMQWRYGFEFALVPGAPPPFHPAME